MTRLTRTWIRKVGVPMMLVVGLVVLISAQSSSVADLRTQLRARYDIVALQRGVALVPRDRTSNVRLIQISDGVVTVDGETLTGRELTQKLGRDASLIVQASYLDEAGRRELTAGGSATRPAVAEPPAPPAVPEPPSAPADASDRMARTNMRYGDIIRIASGSATVEKYERIEGEVVAILCAASIDGEVMRDVTVIAGPLRLGPNAVVRGDVTVVGGHFDRDPGAIILGSINDVGIGSRSWSHGRVFPRVGPVFGLPLLFGDGPGRLFAATGTALRILLTVVLALIVIAVARPAVERVSERAVASPARAGLAGLLAELLFFPALIAVTIVLAVSVVGIPLLVLIPFAIGGFLILMLVGFTGAAYVTGNRVTRRFGREDSGAFAAVAVGVVTLAAATLFAKLIWIVGGGILGVPLVAMGYLVEYVAWTIGFGAVILAWFEHRRAINSPAPTPITT